MRKYQNRRGYWKTKDGKYIKIPKMSNLHLAMVVQMIESNAHKNWVKHMMGEIKYTGVLSSEYEDFLPAKYKELIKEMEKRIKDKDGEGERR